MLRNLTILASLLVIFCTPCFAAADKSPDSNTVVVRDGGLMCRTVEVQQTGSCDAACGKVGMICTGLTVMQSPEQGCGDRTVSPSAKCRCCAVAR
jgi:hypothetical protein